ncbi:MAG: hypothetical protein EP329_26545 [Deltaproteobacteria bacterium]|nr:MAG: hypothetical protein EP329_26545 [Deltaproteobacteria bacterium]
MSPARRAALALAVTSALATSVTAAAPTADYDLDATAWNAVGYLVTTGTEARVDVEPTAALDLSQLRPDEVLLWLYPQSELPVADLSAFVDDGGHLILADDQGSSAPLLAAFGIERAPAPPASHRRWFEGQDGLPVLSPAGDHFLFFNVDEIVANHPAALTGAGSPILSFDGGDAHLVVERRVGAGGALLAIGDPSIFLNQMLRRFYGNKQFAANVMRVYCEHEPCRLRLLLPDTTVSGHYTGGLGRFGALPRLFERAATAINDALAALNSTLTEPPWSVSIALLLALVAAMLLALALAAWRRPVEAPALAVGVPARSPIVAEAIGLAAVRSDADFSALALALAEQAEHLLETRSIEDWVAGHRRLPRGETTESLHLLRHAVLRVKRDTASLRSRQPPAISAERFVRFYEDVQTLARFGNPRR